jgi:hypothetical protein
MSKSLGGRLYLAVVPSPAELEQARLRLSGGRARGGTAGTGTRWHSTERYGYKCLSFPERPWYGWKEEPSFADIYTALRRLSWLEKLRILVGKDSPHNKLVAELAELASRVG